MVKRLTRQGNSVALVLDRELLAAMRLEEGAEVEVSTNGEAIVITPVRKKKDAATFAASVAAIDARWAGAFKRLAE